MSVSILIVEDDPATCVLWTKHLAFRGWDVQIVSNAEDAEIAIANHLPSAVILDIMLETSTTGWDLLARLRASSRTATLPIFIVSTLDEPRLAREAGATDSLCKPCSPFALVTRISLELDQESSQAVASLE